MQGRRNTGEQGGKEDIMTRPVQSRPDQIIPLPKSHMNPLTTSESPTSTRPSVRSTEAESESFGAESLDHTETTVPSSQNSPPTSQQRLSVHRAESYVPLLDLQSFNVILICQMLFPSNI